VNALIHAHVPSQVQRARASGAAAAAVALLGVDATWAADAGAPPEDDQLRRFLPRDGGEGAGPGGAAGPAAPAATGGAGGDAASLNALVVGG
jgi:hypothetical protein